MSEASSEPVSDCLFCRIVAGDIPADIVAESERSVAFRDISPQAPTHVLVVPRRHIVDASAVVASDADDIVDLLLVAQQVSESEGIAESGYRLIMNVGKDAQNSVGHLHLHVIGGAPLRGSLG
ncbi:MAG: histidine triad nucleotide-binding protein [Acidimicrobiales bacterium]